VALFDAVAGLNISLNGFLDEVRRQGHEPLPMLLCYAKSGAHVTRHAFETIVAMMLDDLAAAQPLDAVYLDLHGAMVAEDYDDGEGELMRRVRAAVGPALPVVAALDYHANVTPAMMENASALAVYRTNPHMDKYETGARAARLVHGLLNGEALPFQGYRRLPFLIPSSWQCTLAEPLLTIMQKVEALEGDGVASLSLTVGFPGADVPDLGPAVFAFGQDRAAVEGAVDALYEEVLGREGEFAGELFTPAEAVRRAIELAPGAAGPVILVDTQDNPGGGGSSDTMAVFASLVRQGAAGAVVVMIHDPETAAQAHEAGIGAEIAAALGGRSGLPGEAPFTGPMTVEALGDGEITCTGPMDRGLKLHLGPMALLRSGGVRAVVASEKHRATDRALLTHLGIEAGDQKIIALKESTHFLSDYGAVAGPILVVEGPGPNVVDTLKIPYRRLGPNIRIAPLGPTRGERS
jgi:microcystin degradation protein MlrC